MTCKNSKVITVHLKLKLQDIAHDVLALWLYADNSDNLIRITTQSWTDIIIIVIHREISQMLQAWKAY